MGLRGCNNPRPFLDVLSGQDCTLRERAKARECRPTPDPLKQRVHPTRLQLRLPFTLTGSTQANRNDKDAPR